MDGTSRNLSGIWLKVQNVRHEGGRVSIQVEGDCHDREPVWWPVKLGILSKDELDAYGKVLDSLDRKKTILARLACCTKEQAKAFGLNARDSPFLACDRVRLQFTDSRSVL